jgi:succinyl-diaminopimelate desuccinylase
MSMEKYLEKNELIKSIDRVISKKQIQDLTIYLCSQDTTNPPGNECLCNEILEAKIKEVGLSDFKIIEKEKGRSNIIARLKGKYPGKKVAVLCHSDVVPVKSQVWQTDPFAPVVKNGRIFARGVADNKGPLASVLEAIRVFKLLVDDDFAGEIVLVVAADEELGSESGLKYLLKEGLIDCDFALVPDGISFSKVIFGEMGIYWLSFDSKGQAYHGSMPERGQNAIVPLSYFVQLLSDFDWVKVVGESEFDHAVMNVGTITGGSAANTVPDEAKLEVMWRYPVGVEKEYIRKICLEFLEKVKAKYPKSQIEIAEKMISYPYFGKKENELFQAYLAAYQDLSFEKPVLKTIRGETFAKYLAQSLGCPVCVNGPEDEAINCVHGPDENIAIDSLVRFAKIYTMFFYNFFSSN